MLHHGSPQLIVRTLSARSRLGFLQFGAFQLRCALGRGGIRSLKREGDGATPRGQFELRHLYYNPKGVRRPRSRLPTRPVRSVDGWCDTPGDRNYNRFVRHPYPSSAERLWRADGLYDLLIILSYNESPRIQGRGSAIFLHIARSGLSPTEGCIALARPDLWKLLQYLKRGAKIYIGVGAPKKKA